ncbi:Sodium-and chloride-dependent transporter [gamma proteobacterium HdN1]|nr:Sodium-and chloride-dependent transporter [gamma proteobacterium HdN1]
MFVTAQQENSANHHSGSRENWSARSGFIMAAIGSAVGLGNIWRFPYVAFENGGGAFLVPYLIALFTAGLPLLFLDYAIGHKYHGAPPAAYGRLYKPASSLGWWQVMVSLAISVYYAAVLAWAARYMLFSVGQEWGEDTEQFLFSTYLDASKGLDFGIVPHLFYGLLIVWAFVMLILYGGVKKGVELSNRIFMPLLFLLFGVLVIKAIRLPGAEVGLNAFFTPDWNAMWNPKVWLAAYGHIFFSLSVGFGIMVTYASYLKPRTNLTGSGMVVGFANSSFEVLAGIGVFAALGFMAQASGVEVKEVVSSGVGLAFVVFPKIISSMGSGGDVFGVLFFASLVVAGITSMVSILEVPICAFQDTLGWSRTKAVTLVCGGAAVISVLLFSTRSSIALVDLVDHFANNIGIVLGALASIVLVSWFKRPLLKNLEAHVNEVSTIRLGRGWEWMLTFVTPAVLLVSLVLVVVKLAREGYGDYPMVMQWGFGWGTVALFFLGAVLLNRLRKETDQ